MGLLLEDRYLPATLNAPPMTDEEFAGFCAQHPDLFFEMTADGELIVMPPAHSENGVRNSRILRQLDAWADKDGRGVATAASAGFVLPNGARRSPDAAWTPNSEIAKLSQKSQNGFWHLCPALVMELRSAWDRLSKLRAKMTEYIENGSELGWLIDPETRSVEIYRPGRDAERLENPQSVKGEGLVESFVLDLRRVWDPLPTPAER